MAIASRTSSGDSEWYWETGKEYVYQYSGRLLTGIPELADVYSGVGINCTVHIQRSTKSSEENMFYLSIKNPKYVRVNEKLESASPSSSNNWRELRLPEFTEVQKQLYNCNMGIRLNRLHLYVTEQVVKIINQIKQVSNLQSIVWHNTNPS